MKQIHRTYADTEVSSLVTSLKCPYCGVEWQEEGVDNVGEKTVVECDEMMNDGCGKKFEVYFDVD